MSRQLTISLSDAAYEYLQDVAAAADEPLEHIVRQSIEGNLPPRINDAPPDMRRELLEMQRLSANELLQITVEQIAPQQQRRHRALLQKLSDKGLTPQEKRELEELRLAADRLMVRKAYAWALLRWLGHPTPALEDIPLPAEDE